MGILILEEIKFRSIDTNSSKGTKNHNTVSCDLKSCKSNKCDSVKSLSFLSVNTNILKRQHDHLQCQLWRIRTLNSLQGHQDNDQDYQLGIICYLRDTCINILGLTATCMTCRLYSPGRGGCSSAVCPIPGKLMNSQLNQRSLMYYILKIFG